MNFNKYVQDAEAFINEVAIEIGHPNDKPRAAKVLRSVLHVFRNRITPAESLQLIAQLPMLIKAIYVDGWKIGNGNYHESRNIGDFIEAFREADSQQAYISDYEAKEAIQAVFRVLKRHVSQGEIFDIIAVLPAEMKSLLAMA